ncbi:hypothetical protein Pst134EA_005514 [Puccinia striiformis f. sp. tritici]|uniref:hypothetical protein n=1 Tax=Puccinia striiformis f. sp. tritici TaxID=168172 RepID=UPI002007E37C|nr:hypothetical protein Pst134EA_005514 [Puccinia striiformis f. sp. tritici]KAH9471627.1 hypothetical protein Pst134EA_005514 [Puccinia striiformis f. sp. tritici]
MKEFKDSYQEMSRMFKEHSVAPQNVPIPATPNPRAIPSLRFATSTPRGERTYAMDTTIGAGDQSFLGTEVPSPDAEQSSQKPEIKLKEESTGVILDVKKTNLYFDGTDVESFLKRVEKTAKIHGAGAPDVAEQLPFILNNRKISEAMEQMEGHETANWELFKKELIRKWGRATPLRRYREDAIPRLIQKTQENQGIKNHTEYKKFVGELEEMIDYFVRMGYSHLNPESGDPLWRVMSTELKKEVTKELAHAKKLRKTKDGRIIVPDLEMLKEYVEISLIIVDFEDDIQEEATPKEAPKKSVKIKDPADQEGSKETAKKLATALDYQQRAPPPHFSRPSSPGFPDTRARYTPMECYYCGGKHAITTCDFYGPDLQERKVYRYQGMYYYPNRHPIVVENGMSVREMVQRYQEEQEKLSHTKSPAPEHTAGIAALEEWESWVPPQVNIDEDELQTNIGFGLRKSQRVQEKNQASGSQPAASKPQEPASKPPPPNQEALNAPSRRKSFPGSWMEEDVTEEEESITKNAGTKDSTPATRKSNQPSSEEIPGKGVSTNKLDKSIRNKFYKQTYTLTLEEIVKIAPHFLKGLQESQLDEEALGKGVHSGRLNCSAGFEEQEKEEETSLNYACPVGMVDMNINQRKIRTLVDTGAEMNIIPDTLADQLGLVTTEIFMRLKGIGGHFTPIVGLAENIQVSVLPGFIHLANFFIVKGSVHTVLGRPFLADHNIRLELSNQKGEVLSFPDTEGRRICIPICLPNTPGWHKEPPGFRQNCSFQVEEWTGGLDFNDKFEEPSRREDQRNNQEQCQQTIPEEESHKSINHQDTEILQGGRLTSQDLYHIPPLDNRYMSNFWKDDRPFELFRKVFSDEWYHEETENSLQLLLELPGGGTSNLDFIHILTDIGTEAFLKCSTWTSQYGQIGYKLRVSIYNEDKKGLKWARNNIPDYKATTKTVESVLEPLQKRHREQF